MERICPNLAYPLLKFFIMKSCRELFLLLLLIICPIVSEGQARNHLDESEFSNPDSTNYSGVIWWWLRCNTSKEAITRDLEEIKEKKLNGVLLFDFGTGGGVKRMPDYLEIASPKWNELIKHSIRECHRLGLEFGMCIANSGCAAPWIAPEDSQQKLVYSLSILDGGRECKAMIPISPKVARDSCGKPICYKDICTLAVPYKDSVALDEIVDISKNLEEDDTLNWEMPEGKWKVYRFGFTPTFRMMNEFRYLDHLRPSLFEEYYQKYFGRILNSLSSEERSAVKYLSADSWEAGVAGWSIDFAKDFQRLRGYDPICYLPIMAGEIIGSRDDSHRFMNDYRQTVSDLIVRHYRLFSETAHRDGMETMCEASGPHQDQADALLCQKYSDVPMGEFWARAKTHRITLQERFLTKEAASAGHIYGKQDISAESFTSVGPQWEESPYSLKPTADRAFCDGVNRLYYHTFTHSPSLTARPGYVYYAGSYINRNNTWWEYLTDWNLYLARNQCMLRKGTPVADVCIFYGDGIRKRISYKQDSSRVDFGYQYDYVNTDVLLNQMSVRNGKICLPSGMEYSIMIIPDKKEISPDVLRKLKELVVNGATIAGPKPERSQSLQDKDRADAYVRETSEYLWGDGTGDTVDRKVGLGRVVNGKKISLILEENNVQKDIIIEDSSPESTFDYIHRSCEDGEIYYIANLKEQKDFVNVSFRVTGKEPQIWQPLDGSVKKLNIFEDDGERISIPLSFNEYESYFVIFKNTEGQKRHITNVDGEEGRYNPEFLSPGRHHVRYSDGRKGVINVRLSTCYDINDPWELAFKDNYLNVDKQTTLNKLASWTEFSDPDLKYYSGTAIYKNTFRISKGLGNGERMILDLGELYNVAEIFVNGHDVGTCWMKPYRMDISDYITKGLNRLEIRVANLWPNRLIGDQKLPPEKRRTITNLSKFTQNDTLMTSGLIGPVRLEKIPKSYYFK